MKKRQRKRMLRLIANIRQQLDLMELDIKHGTGKESTVHVPTPMRFKEFRQAPSGAWIPLGDWEKPPPLERVGVDLDIRKGKGKKKRRKIKAKDWN